jgi:hypothetical protein
LAHRARLSAATTGLMDRSNAVHSINLSAQPPGVLVVMCDYRADLVCGTHNDVRVGGADIGAEILRRVVAASRQALASKSGPKSRRKSARSAHRIVGKNSGRAFALHPGAQALERGFGIEGEVGGAHRTLPISKGNSGRRGLRTAYKKDW